MRGGRFVRGWWPLAAGLTLCAGAAPAVLMDYSCSVAQGFNFSPDQQVVVGHFLSLRIGSRTFDPDLALSDPEDYGGDPLSAFGVLTDMHWEGDRTGPITIGARVSAANRNLLWTLAHSSQHDWSVTFAFEVYDYDDAAHRYYRCFGTGGELRDGVVLQQGGTLYLAVDSAPATDVVEPKNYQFSITIASPDNQAQFLYRKISVSSFPASMPWGDVPEPAFVALAALACAGFAASARRRRLTGQR